MKQKRISKEKKLRKENKELKKALCICLNRPLAKRLACAIERVKKGKYETEEEFFKDSPLLAH